MDGVVIGVLAYGARVPSPETRTAAAVVPTAYLDAVRDGGGEPLVVPVGARPEIVLGRVDGLMLLGGTDVDPARYGAQRHPATGAPDRSRDASEAALPAAAAAAAAARRDAPVLGICRGAQMMNVVRGGTLIQHLADLGGSVAHSTPEGTPGGIARHEVTAVPGTELATIVGGRPLSVVSTHHQAVGSLGERLVLAATAPDGTIEAFEDPHARFYCAVQWHPEEDEDRRLFLALVDAAAAARRGW